VANSGGIINGCRELLGWDSAKAQKKIDNIYDRILAILEMAAQEHCHRLERLNTWLVE